MRSLLASTLLLLLSLLSSFTTAQSSSNASAVFVYNGDDDTQFTFALNVEKSSGDVYFHMSSTSEASWLGVGFGSQMKDAFMIIAYPANDGGLVTLSPRIGSGHTEPAYTTEIDVPRYDVSSNANTAEGSDRGFSNIVAEGRCVKCLSWNGGSLDLTKTDQPFIFALGPPFPTVDSTDLSAGLNEHQFYGHFTMDMTAATSQSDANVPAGPYVRKDASQATDTNSDDNPASRIHGAVMGLVFVILLPLGAILLRVWNKLKGHIIVQTIGLVLFCMAFAGGCVVSGLYIRSKNFNSAHQIIGILLLIAMLSQWPLGFLHHRIYKKEQRKTIMGKIHRYLGPVIIFFGVLNGGLGFQLAGARWLAIPYAVIVLIIAVIFIALSLGVPYYRRRKGGQKGPEGYQYPQFAGQAPQYAPPPGGPPSDYPPPYGQDVPLTRFGSSQSVPRVDADAGPVQPRPMV